MFEWWAVLCYLTFMGGNLGYGMGDGLGLVFGTLIGFCIGASLPSGPTINFDPNDL